MIVLFSPTKMMDFNSVLPEAINSAFGKTDRKRAIFFDEACMINALLREFDREGLEDLMKISPALSENVAASVRSFGLSTGRPAIAAYCGTAFKALDAASLSIDDLEFAQKHLRILSGMYGVLRPLDGIESYRMEMKTALCITEDENLNRFWKTRITGQLLGEQVLNLASGEYLKAVDTKKLDYPVISIQFKDLMKGKLKTVGMYSKSARGMMLRTIIQERIENPENLLSRKIGGYQFDSGLSNDYNWVFTRSHKEDQ